MCSNRAYPDLMSIKWVFAFPEFRLTGKYKINGQVFSLGIQGSGTFWMIMGSSYI